MKALLWITIAGVVLLGIVGATVWSILDIREITEYLTPALQPDDELVDDRLEDKRPAFDPDVADSRLINDIVELNASAAVIRLDVPMLKPDQDAELLKLYPSYAAACKAVAGQGTLLPSVNLVDGKAKQFDDGLYAALDQAYLVGVEGKLTSHVALVKKLFDGVSKDSEAAAFLAAALFLADVHVDLDAKRRARANEMLADFQNDIVRSKPIGFYTWNSRLEKCFRFLRFLSQPFPACRTDLAKPLAKALAADAELRDDYAKAVGFYVKLTNPFTRGTLLDIPVDGAIKDQALEVAVFPASTSREYELFTKLFPGGLPPNVDLMRELIRRIRSGEVDLKPRQNGGWYDYQVHALETLLLPEKAAEKDKLMLSKAYKKRMLEAFQALLVKRRETHVRQLDVPMSKCCVSVEINSLAPRLRVEPNPSYFLRTARAYAFLENFLLATVGEPTLAALHGLRKEGSREANLGEELRRMRDMFYGLYLVSAEDIGLKPTFLDGENVDVEACKKAALDWLARAFDDPDLAEDTRVAVPIFIDLERGVTRTWATLGVRLARLEVRYARPPHVREKGTKEWKVFDGQLDTARYLIPVDEFAEVELASRGVLTREELREICDRERTRGKIVDALDSR
jgi:hypothetical protein